MCDCEEDSNFLFCIKILKNARGELFCIKVTCVNTNVQKRLDVYACVCLLMCKRVHVDMERGLTDKFDVEIDFTKLFLVF